MRVGYKIITSLTNRLLSNSCVYLKLLGISGHGRKTNLENETIEQIFYEQYFMTTYIILPLMSKIPTMSDNG